MEKILFFSSQKTEYPILNSLFEKYSVQTVTNLSKKNFDSIIKSFQPQTIIFDEHIPLKVVKNIVNKYPFIPCNVIGEIGDPQKLEKFLELGINLIKLPITEKELEKILSNIMWFSLSKPDLWQQEVNLSLVERKRRWLLNGIKVLIVGVIILTTFFLSNKAYNNIIKKNAEQKIYFEINLPYVTPSDITFLEKSYLISDWNIKNIFQHEVDTDKMVRMFIPEQKFNSITSYTRNRDEYIFTSSIFVDKIYIYRYPDFDLPFKEIVPRTNLSIMAMYADKNKLFILDNKKVLYEFKLEEDFSITQVSSYTITDFYPVDIFVYNNYLYFLDDKNVLYKFTYPELEKISEIYLKTFFQEEKPLVSFAINNKWLYLLNEQEKKMYKISNKILM
jgi:hypothetical protein